MSVSWTSLGNSSNGVRTREVWSPCPTFSDHTPYATKILCFASAESEANGKVVFVGEVGGLGIGILLLLFYYYPQIS